MAYLTATQTMDALQMPQRSLLRLRESNLIPSWKAGRETRYDRATVEELASWRAPVKHGLARNVRLGLPERDLWEDRMVGWDEEWSPEVKREAARKYWDVKDPEPLIRAALVATCVGFVVGVWKIDDYEIGPRGLSWVISDATSEMKQDWEKKRLLTGPGAKEKTLEPQP